MTKKFKFLLILTLLILSFVFARKWYLSKTDGFTLAHIVPKPGQFLYVADLDQIKTSKEEEATIRQLLDQPFTYLGKGGTMYAFLSADKKVVLKFLKYKYLRNNPLLQFVSLFPFVADKDIEDQQRRLKKFNNLYNGYQITFQNNKEHSGLIFLHFVPTVNRFGKVTLYDKRGLAHEIELDQTVFIVQQKADVTEYVLNNLLHEGKVDEAATKIAQLVSLYENSYSLGLYDRDYGIIHNTAFLEDKAIHIDMGRMTYDERMKDSENSQKDLVIVKDRIKRWLNKNHPQYAKEIGDKI